MSIKRTVQEKVTLKQQAQGFHMWAQIEEDRAQLRVTTDKPATSITLNNLTMGQIGALKRFLNTVALEIQVDRSGPRCTMVDEVTNECVMALNHAGECIDAAGDRLLSSYKRGPRCADADWCDLNYGHEGKCDGDVAPPVMSPEAREAGREAMRNAGMCADAWHGGPYSVAGNSLECPTCHAIAPLKLDGITGKPHVDCPDCIDRVAEEGPCPTCGTEGPPAKGYG